MKTLFDDIASDPKFPRGEYARHVLFNGTKPGVLSGSELRGKARKYGAWYARQRAKVISVAASHGLRETVGKHNARIWAV